MVRASATDYSALGIVLPRCPRRLLTVLVAALVGILLGSWGLAVLVCIAGWEWHRSEQSPSS